MMRCLTVVDASGFNDDEWILPTAALRATSSISNATGARISGIWRPNSR